jgi:hypothetical protein
LPTDATRCVNCHSRGSALGPPLTHASLTSEQRRRGGPASRYEQASFCALLRTGIDPAHVLIARVMPRYELDAASCQALWSYVSAS